MGVDYERLQAELDRIHGEAVESRDKAQAVLSDIGELQRALQAERLKELQDDA